MLNHKFRRDALELRFHRIEESMVFGRVTAEKLQSASLSYFNPATGSSVQNALLDEVAATGDAAGSHKTCGYPSCAVGHSHRFAHLCS